MALKKSELYSSLWASCDELRGGMDASQYKDYVLVMLFVKYVSDKYAGVPYAPITIPAGASFKDMAALKGKPDIGDQVNKKILGPLAAANKLSDMPDFNDATKLGSGQEMVDRLTNLIAIFEDKRLDFSKNRADGDDILGDAYEYLMRHFATESGKSKGQFYTPAEVSRIMAQIIGIRDAETTNNTTVFDPTCGSGSLLLKVGDEAGAKVTLYGQEKDAATAGLARMNMILHNNPTALVEQANTLAIPRFLDEQGQLKTFDYVVANPPFSDKRWSNGVDLENDPHGRFQHFGVPPARQGDYAYLLHIVRSLKSTGKGACILPHGVLFRGNAEGDIRRNLVRKGYIKGIIGLPPNLFYGTGIPACIVVVDKEHAHARKGVFLIDASGGFLKDGNKNRLREQDIHRIVDVFTRQLDVPGYSRTVPFDEIEKNEFNLNIPRYIDSQQAEDLQDIDAHLNGGIPVADIDALAAYWAVCPSLRGVLFKDNRPGYVDLAVDKAAIKATIFNHPEFVAFVTGMEAVFAEWRERSAARLIESLEQLLAKKRLIKQGTMWELFTARRRLPGFRNNWGAVALREIGRTFGGLTGKAKRDFGRGEARYITFMNIMANVVIDRALLERVDVAADEQQNAVKKGDLLLNGSSETPNEVGLCALVAEDFDNVFLNSFCFGFRLHPDAAADGLYWAYYLRSQEGRKRLKSLAQGAIRYNISKSAFLKTRFPLPEQPEQTAIAGVLAEIDAEIGALQARLKKVHDLKQGMMQNLLTGKIRLV